MGGDVQGAGGIGGGAGSLPRYLTESFASIITWDLSLSNLGRLDLPTAYGSLRLEALYGPIFAVMPGDRLVGVNTFDGRARFTFTSEKATIHPPTADQLIQGAMDRLSAVMQP